MCLHVAVEPCMVPSTLHPQHTIYVEHFASGNLHKIVPKLENKFSRFIFTKMRGAWLHEALGFRVSSKFQCFYFCEWRTTHEKHTIRFPRHGMYKYMYLYAHAHSETSAHMYMCCHICGL